MFENVKDEESIVVAIDYEVAHLGGGIIEIVNLVFVDCFRQLYRFGSWSLLFRKVDVEHVYQKLWFVVVNVSYIDY